MLARTATSCPENDTGNVNEETPATTGLGAGGSSPVRRGQACIQAARPRRMKRANPQEPLADQAPLTPVRRRSSYRAVQ